MACLVRAQKPSGELIAGQYTHRQVLRLPEQLISQLLLTFLAQECLSG